MMNKITLFDENCGGACSGVSQFFAEPLEEFERSWLHNPKVCDEQKSRYRISKAGYLISDYYTCSKDLNIFQEDDKAQVLLETEFQLEDREFRLKNFYNCAAIIYAREAQLKYRKIKFQDTYYWIGRYKLIGVCREDYLNHGYWMACNNYGNKILNMIQPSCMAGKIKRNCEKEIFCNDCLETCCWVTIRESKDENAYPFHEEYLLSEEIIDSLMCDILGEAG